MIPVDPNQIVTAIVAIITALGLRDGIPNLIKHWTGRANQEKLRVQELIRERDEAEDDRDHESAKRRKLEEALSQHRRLLIEKGMNPTELPPWPIPPTT